jgi:hypothetical protein
MTTPPNAGPPGPDPLRRRTMPAGHAVVVLAIAFGVATLLNADSLMRTAEGLPLGSTKRAIAVGVMRPVRWVSDALQVTEPRSALDRALGKRTSDAEDPFSEFAPATVSGSPPTQPGATNPTAEPGTVPRVKRFRPTAERPLRVYVAGDSLSFEYGLAMGRLAASDAELEMIGAVDYHVASGLARPDFFNWPEQLNAQMDARDPDVVVFMVGSNDDQPLASPDGHTYRDYTDPWRFEYSRRAGAVMDQVVASGRVIVWVGVPTVADAPRSAGYELLNQLVKTQADARPDAYFVDTFKLFRDRKGKFQQFLPDETGQVQKMRANDGVHFERAGGDRLARATLRSLDRIYHPRP